VEAVEAVTWLELAKEEAAKVGVILTDDAADFILWERTAFPMIGPDECRRQIAEEIEANWRNFDPKTSGPTFWDKLGSED
jgi:hypothetical protein